MSIFKGWKERGSGAWCKCAFCSQGRVKVGVTRALPVTVSPTKQLFHGWARSWQAPLVALPDSFTKEILYLTGNGVKEQKGTKIHYFQPYHLVVFEVSRTDV